MEQVAGLEAQQAALGATGCQKLFSEQASSVGQRDQLMAALDQAREGAADWLPGAIHPSYDGCRQIAEAIRAELGRWIGERSADAREAGKRQQEEPP